MIRNFKIELTIDLIQLLIVKIFSCKIQVKQNGTNLWRLKIIFDG